MTEEQKADIAEKVAVRILSHDLGSVYDNESERIQAIVKQELRAAED